MLKAYSVFLAFLPLLVGCGNTLFNSDSKGNKPHIKTPISEIAFKCVNLTKSGMQPPFIMASPSLTLLDPGREFTASGNLNVHGDIINDSPNASGVIDIQLLTFSASQPNTPADELTDSMKLSKRVSGFFSQYVYPDKTYTKVFLSSDDRPAVSVVLDLAGRTVSTISYRSLGKPNYNYGGVCSFSK